MSKSKVTQEKLDSYLYNNHGIRPGTIKIKEVPLIKTLDSKILEQIVLEPKKFDMDTWHQDDKDGFDGQEIDEEEFKKRVKSCNTSHCRAGWAVVLGKKKGIELEIKWGAGTAGAVIYLVNKGRVPNFMASQRNAMKSIKNSAGKE